MRRSASVTTGGQANGAATTVGSCPSGPAIAAKTSAQSATVRASGPILSIVQLSAMQPVRLTRPKVGRRPVTPQRAAGETIEPYVSVPMAKPANPAATAAADPADDPLDPSSGFQGLRVMPPNQTSPQASAPTESLPSNTAPAASSRATTVASWSITWSRYGVAPQVVGAPRTASRSFAPQG